MKHNEMSHDNTLFNFTETEHLIVHSSPKFLNSLKYCAQSILDQHFHPCPFIYPPHSNGHSLK